MERELKPTRTQQVLEKWGVDGEMNDEDIRLAASSFARIRVKNTIMKWVAVGGILFVATFIGLMIGSVVLGIEATKEYKVKEQVLVQKNGTALGTSEAFYSVNLRLTTPMATIKGIKSLKFNKGSEGTLQFNVVSFYFIPGRTLILYGVNHVAEVLADGTVEVSPITTVNGARSIDDSKRDEYTEVSATGDLNTATNVVNEINQCSQLLLIQETGSYQLTADIECTLLQPLLSLPGQSFRGTINGNGHFITLNIESDGPVALFRTLKQASIINLKLRGQITGVQNCGGFAVETYPGTTFTSSGAYANIQCTNNGAIRTTIGGFTSLLRNENDETANVQWSTCVSQGHFTLQLSDLSYLNFQGGYYGLAVEKVSTKFEFSYSASTHNQRGGSYRVDQFGFKSVPHSRNVETTEKRTHVYVPEDCYNFNKTSAIFINMCVDFYIENNFEEQCCCSPVNFDSCPYIYCNPQNPVCMECRYGGHRKEEQTSTSYETDPVQIYPNVKQTCSNN